jgi:hypothetical protein
MLASNGNVWDRAFFQKVARRLHSRLGQPNITGLESIAWQPCPRIKLAPKLRKSLIKEEPNRRA